MRPTNNGKVNFHGRQRANELKPRTSTDPDRAWQILVLVVIGALLALAEFF